MGNGQGNFTVKGIQRPAWLQASRAPRIGVSPAGYDNMGAVLGRMNMSFEPLTWEQIAGCGTAETCDVLFLNCTNVFPPLPLLDSFVRSGGHVFCSDWASTCIAGLGVPGLRFARSGSAGSTTAQVLEPEFISILQRAQVPISFDQASWDVSVGAPMGARVLMTAHAPVGVGILGYFSFFAACQIPVAWSIAHGRGSITYTSFHHHAQASEIEGILLSLLALTPVSLQSGVSVTDLARKTLRRM